jgi:hypothetical protein
MREPPGPKTVRRDLVAAVVASAPVAARLPERVLLELFGRGVDAGDRRWLRRRAKFGSRLREGPAA